MTEGSAKEIFVLSPPSGPPKIPDCWSWSGLAAWRRCPRRWWLERSEFPNAPTPYPNPFGAAAVEGMLLHDAVERFSEHVAAQRSAGFLDDSAIRTSFPVRRVMQERLRYLLGQGASRRADPARLLARVSIDSCVNAFRGAASTCLSSVAKSPKPEGAKASRARGAEVQLTAKTPRVCGRIDYVDSHGIVDFKTGEPKVEDQDQVRFYALLLWLVTGTRPGQLAIAYLRHGKVEPVAVPTDNEMQATADALRHEIDSIEKDVAVGKPEARPSVDNCRYCSVRQLCSDYWACSAAEPLRLGPTTPMLESPQWVDVEFGSLPERTVSNSYVGEGFVERFEAVDVRIGFSHVVAGRKPIRARILNALVQVRGGRWSVSAGPGSEAFWIEKEY